MSKLAYKFLNPIVKTILRSPLHGLMSYNTVLLEYTGIKSGRQFRLPVSYAESGDQIICFTAHKNVWWRNLVGGRPVDLTLRGLRRQGTADVEIDDMDAIVPLLDTFLRATPRDAGPAGVRLDAQKNPNADDVAAAAEKLVCVRIQLA